MFSVVRHNYTAIILSTYLIPRYLVLKILQGKLILDGQEIKESLIDMVASTQNSSNNNNVIKFGDNSRSIKYYIHSQSFNLLVVNCGEESKLRYDSLNSHAYPSYREYENEIVTSSLSLSLYFAVRLTGYCLFTRYL